MMEYFNTSMLAPSFSDEIEINDDRETVINVQNVSMKFNMASEQLNNLKEYVLKLLKHELFFEEFTALDDISFEVKKGDVFGILGTNGSGKSTLLKIIAGVLEPSSGFIEAKGTIAPLIELGAGFDMELSARENIYLNGALLGYEKDFIEKHFDEIVEFAEIEQFLDMPMKNYSSGMVARIAFSIATVIVPDILIVDEVLSVGDFMFQRKCEDRIKTLIEQYGVTVLIVSHSNEQIARLCSRAAWIEKGHLRLIGNATEVCNIYGSLGGRTGSHDAENLIFHILTDPENETTSSKAGHTIAGNTPAATCANLIDWAWGGETYASAVFACDGSHLNSLIACPVAGALDAPIFSVKGNALPFLVEESICRVKPERILVFDVENTAQELIEILQRLPWNPKIIHVNRRGNESLYLLSARIVEEGMNHQLWNDEVAVISIDDIEGAFALSPYLYATRCPVILMHVNDNDVARTMEYFRRHGTKRLIALNGQIEHMIEIIEDEYDIDIMHFSHVESSTHTDDIAQFVWQSFCHQEPKALLTASQAHTQWTELASCGAAGGRKRTALQLLPSENLDDIVKSLSLIEDHRSEIDELIFLGDGGLSPSDQKLLLSTLNQ